MCTYRWNQAGNIDTVMMNGTDITSGGWPVTGKDRLLARKEDRRFYTQTLVQVESPTWKRNIALATLL